MAQKKYQSRKLNRSNHRKQERIAKAVQLGSVALTAAITVTAGALLKKKKG